MSRFQLRFYFSSSLLLFSFAPFSLTGNGSSLFLSLLTSTRLTMTLNYTSAYYSVILANAYNQLRINIICTSEFASWSIFTPADDEFLEECMNVFLEWRVITPSIRWTSILNRPLNSFPSIEQFNESFANIQSCNGYCRCEDESDSDYDSEGYDSDSNIDYDGDSEDSEGDDMSSSLENEENTEEGYCSDDTSLDCDTYSIFGGGSRISSPPQHTVIISGPFADRLAALLPPIGTPFLINGCLVSSTVSNDSSVTLSSLFLRDRSISHHSILSSSSSSSIDSHICGSECYYYDRLTTEDECEPLLGESTTEVSMKCTGNESTEDECESLMNESTARCTSMTCTGNYTNGSPNYGYTRYLKWKEDGVLDDSITSSSSDSSMEETGNYGYAKYLKWIEERRGILNDSTSSSSSAPSNEETDMSKKMAIEMMKECDETIKRMEEIKKRLKKMIE